MNSTPDKAPASRGNKTFPVPAALKSHGPARIVALCNQKGGVGKTTTTINLAASLAEYGRKVLVVDFDPQGALSAGFGVHAYDGTLTVLELLRGDVKDAHEVIQPTSAPGVDILPANIELSVAEVFLVSELSREHALAGALKQVKDEYDVILIDCQPSLGLLTVNALTASHGVIVPLECEFFALRGLAMLVETIEKVRDRLNPALTLDGILLTMYDPRTLHSREVVQHVVDAFGDKVMQTAIARTVKFPDASIDGVPMNQFAPDHPATESYRQLARELISRGSLP